MSDETQEKRIIGTPFQKGNPGGGRPKMPEHIKKAFQGPLTELSMSVIRNILDGTDEDAKASDRLKASEMVLDRSWGKPVQAIEADVTAEIGVHHIGKPDFLK